MLHANQIGMLKEQLRAKSLELKKKNAERAKQENKVQHVIEISRKKISDLKQEIEKVNSSIRAPAWDGYSTAQTEQKVSESISEPKNNFFKELKLSKTVQKLKRENFSLTKQIRAEKSKREQLAQEKTRLLEEIKRLEGSSEKISQLKAQILNIDQEFKDSRRKYKKLYQEKNQLLAEYKKFVLEKTKSEKNDADQNANEINRELEVKLELLNDEKEKLEKELKNKNQLFQKKLTEKIKQVEEELQKKAKVLRKEKDRGNHFAEQAMDEGEGPGWIITYSDMATLLLTFFILYYSIAAQNLGRFKEAILEESEQNLGLIELIDSTKIKTSLQYLTGFKSNNILNDINNFATDENNLGITENKSKIVVRIPGKTLFQPASAVLEKEGWPILEEAAGIFKKYPNYKIHIQGHTDDNPIATEKFPTNWELSATRATAVLRFFMDKGLDPGRLTATGYADTFPQSPNTTEQGRALNRRVEFVLEKITQ